MKKRWKCMGLPKLRKRSETGLTEAEAYLALYGAHTRSENVSDSFPGSWWARYDWPWCQP